MTHTTNNEAATYELSDQDLDTVNGGFLPFLIAAAVVVAADVAIGIYAATHNPNNK
jgi:lactobin A/cerein 7B family class IIb bacteriocin